jgi:Xaa-Pro aminopeptidase
MEPVLKRGYASWDRDVLPRDEFDARVEAVRAALRDANLEALVLVNHSLLGVMVDYADMAYLTGLQSGGMLLLAREREPTFVSFGGGRELAFLRTQTWIEDVAPGGKEAFQVARDRLRRLGIASGAIGTVGAASLAANPRARLQAAFADYELRPFDAELGRLRVAKRPREVLAVRIARAIVVSGIEAALAAFEGGADNTAALIAAERAARMGKARDVRVLASMGGAELRPFEGRLAGRHSPLRIWVAAQYQGYWAEAAATAPALRDNVAERAVAAMERAARAGNRAGDVAAAALAVLPREAAASALAYGLGGTIGLAHDEGLVIEPDNTERIPDAALLALRCVAHGPEPSIAASIVGVDRDGARAIEPLRLD